MLLSNINNYIPPTSELKIQNKKRED